MRFPLCKFFSFPNCYINLTRDAPPPIPSIPNVWVAPSAKTAGKILKCKSFYIHPKLLVHLISGKITPFNGCYPLHKHLQSNSMVPTEQLTERNTMKNSEWGLIRDSHHPPLFSTPFFLEKHYIKAATFLHLSSSTMLCTTQHLLSHSNTFFNPRFL